MIKQNVFIINYNSLYEILYEFKENLSFKIIKYENEDDFINSSNLDMANSLIISKFKRIPLSNKNVSEKLIQKECINMINVMLLFHMKQ